MKLLDVINSPWAIMPDKLNEIRDIYLTHLRGEKIDIKGIEARLGFTHEDDVLPDKCHEDLGSNVPHFNTREFFAEVKKGVYEKMGEKYE